MSVKYFHSGMADAPVLNGVSGSLITVLDACLVNGFSLRSVDAMAITSNVATVTISAGHGYEVDAVVLIEGATPAALNGHKRVLSATLNTLTFAATGVPDQSATGTITARLAPAGWLKAFSGAQLAVYRSPHLAGTQMALRVDDTASQNARAVGYEAMSDLNTGFGAFPMSVQVAGGLYWPKANSSATTARPWLVVADDRTFYVWVNTGTAGFSEEGFVYGFGDFTSTKGGDPYACFITGATGDISTTTAANAQTLGYHDLAGSAALSQWVARSFTAIGGALPVSRKAESYNTANTYSGNTASIAYPNGPDNGLYLSRSLVMEISPLSVRGVMRGLLFLPHATGAATFAHRSRIAGQGPLAGRQLMVVKNAGACAASTATQAAVLLDITGPWG